MFDLPVKTRAQRAEANGFRMMLIDEGFWMAQYSVYVRYSPVVRTEIATQSKIKACLPNGGEVRIFYLSDKQWSRALRFRRAAPEKPDETPEQLAFF